MKWFKPRRIFLLLGTLISLSNQAHADEKIITSGKNLVATCYQALVALDKGLETLKPGEQEDAFLCMAYIGGVMATAKHANELAKLRYAQSSTGNTSIKDFNLYCFNWEVTHQDVARIIYNYAHNHQKLLAAKANELAMRALQSTFPCH